MGGIFGTITKKSCVADVFYGTDYNSHLGTRRGGLAMYSKERGSYVRFTIWKVLTSVPSLNQHSTVLKVAQLVSAL